MHTSIKALIVAGLASGFALPALAASHMDASTMTCGDFMAMDEEGQMTAMEEMQSASMATDGAASADATTTTGDAASTDAMSSEDQMASVMTACESDSSMTMMDAMSSSM